jgi:transposase-like protein
MSNTTMKKRESNSSVQPAKSARRKYDEEFKQQALMMVRNGQSVRLVAEALGISENLLHQWKRAARANQSTAKLEVVRTISQFQPLTVDRRSFQLENHHLNVPVRPLVQDLHALEDFSLCSERNFTCWLIK